MRKPNILMALVKIKGLTLKEVAAQADITYRTIQEYSYRHEDLRNLAAEKVYDIVEYLIGRKTLDINNQDNDKSVFD